MDWTLTIAAIGAITGIGGLCVAVWQTLSGRTADRTLRTHETELRARDHALHLMIPMMKWAGRWEWIEEGLDSAGLPQSMALNAIGEFDGYMTMPPELIALRGKLHELGEAAGPLQALWYAHQILQEHSDELVSYMRGDIADEIKVSEVRNRLVGQSLDMARSVRIAAEALRRLYA